MLFRRLAFAIALVPLVLPGALSGCFASANANAKALYVVGGTVTGLTGTGLVLGDRDGDVLPVSAGSGTFTFPALVVAGAPYLVTVTAQPSGQTCVVAGGAGVVGNADVTTVSVSCTKTSGAPTYTIGGSVTGLTAPGLVLEDNGADDLAVASGADAFTFATPLVPGGPFAVTVRAQPAGLTCAVTAGSGIVAQANVTSVSVTCTAVAVTAPTYTVGGSIAGLSASGLLLQDNGGDSLTVPSGATTFTFATALPAGHAYSVTALTPPAGLACAITGGTGTIATANVVSVDIVCSKGWTWMAGSDAISSAGSYGTAGTAATASEPPAREAGSWATGPGGKLWLFGGYTYVGSGPNSYFNDLWSYDTATGEWTWVSGASSTGSANAYPATAGTGGSAAYFPGARSYATLWADPGGNVWLFGGYDGSNHYSDLWKFDGQYWTWVAGSNAPGQAGSYPASAGMGGAAYYPGARDASASWVDASGNLWLFGGYNTSGGDLNDLWEYTNASWTWVGGSSSTGASGTYGTLGMAAPGNFPGARLSPAFGIDSTGALWMFGGYGKDSAGNAGYLNDLWKFSSGQWTWASGSEFGDSPTPSAVFGVFPSTPGTGGPSYMPGGRQSPCGWVDASGNFWVFGGWGYDGAGAQNYLGDLWKFDGTNWTWESGSDTANVPGVYGMLGIPSLTSYPGTRWNPVGWYSGGQLWMFGGSGNDTGTTPGVLNDLWRYQP